MSKHDRRSAGRSCLVPFDGGETPALRHERRWQAALEAREIVRAWCRAAGLGLRISNGGHHWVFTRGSLRVEWWPSSAKLVVNQHYDDGVHVHDVLQLFDQLRSGLEKMARERLPLGLAGQGGHAMSELRGQGEG